MKRSFAILMAMLLSTSLFATLSLVVKPLSGMEYFSALENIGKITYSGEYIHVYDAENTLIFSDLVLNVQRLHFSDKTPSVPTNVEDLQQENATKLLVFPNPTQDLLSVKNAKAEVVRLYTATGQLLQTAQVHDGEVQLDISSCSAGSYLLLCGNEAFQVIKQ